MIQILFLVSLFLFFPYRGEAEVTMKLTSPDFKNNESIPAKFTCQGEDVSPALEISDVPSDTKSLVLIVDDPDAPRGVWVHWVVFNIDFAVRSIAENFAPGVLGRNDSGGNLWSGPCPPWGAHRYFFKLYALDITALPLKEGATKAQVEVAMQGHIISRAELVGLFKKS